MSDDVDTEKKTLCLCGCQLPVEGNKRYIRGHNTRLSDPDNPSKPKNGFQKGNTFGKGRPEGSRHKVTLAAESIMHGEAEALTRKAIELALDGNIPALKICIERLYPVRKTSPIQVTLPEIEDICQIPSLSKAILQYVCNGTITPDEGAKLSTVVADLTRAMQVENLRKEMDTIDESL